MRKKKLYVPITRSGSSILASIFTQLLQEAGRQRRAEIDRRVAGGKLSPFLGEIYKHPFVVWFIVWILVMFGYLIFVAIVQVIR